MQRSHLSSIGVRHETRFETSSVYIRLSTIELTWSGSPKLARSVYVPVGEVEACAISISKTHPINKVLAACAIDSSRPITKIGTE